MSQSTLDATLTSEMQSSSYGDFTSDTKKLIGLDEGDHPSNDECCSNQGMLEHRPVKGNMEESDNEQKNKIVDVKSLTPTQLESEVYRLRSEVKLLTAMCQELEKERAGLSDELEKLKQSLQDDEGLVKNKTDDNKELETLQRRLQGLEDEVVNLIAERDTFQSSLEELDVQHQQAIDQILASRDLMQQRYKEILQENDCLLGKLKEHEEEKLTVMQLKVNVENEAKALTVSRDEWATEDAKKTSMILNVSKLVERFEDQSFVSDKDSVLDESCENEENQLLHRVALMIKSYQKIYLDNKNKDSVLQDFNRRLTQLQTSLQDKDRIIQELLISNKILEENKRPLELTIDEQRDRDLKLETTDSTDNEEISKLRAKVQALEAELKLTKESSNVQNGSLSAISAELEISGAKVQDLEIAFPSHKSDQTQKSYIENCSQTDTLPGTSIGSQVEEVAREVTEDGEVVVKFEKEVLELKQAIANLENQLLEKDRRIDSINDILHVYKENLDPDQDAIKKQQEEMVAKFETQIKALELERDRMMAILNDKARENSALKLEVHRLVNVVSAERAALGKMQRDCEEMSRTKSNVQVNSETEDMTKEAMKNLAHLVREREIEIEALRQRSATLLTLLQEQDDSAATNGSSVTDAHDRPNVTTIQTLLSERDHLKGLNERHQMEREQIINALNQKHQESVGYHAEIQRLLGMLDQVNKKYSTLEESHNSVVRQLEDQKKAAFETATEMVTLSSKTSELERNNEALRTKLDHLRLGASQPSQEESSLEGLYG